MDNQYYKAADKVMGRLLNYFKRNYEIKNDVYIGGYCAVALAEYHFLENKSLFGLNKIEMQGKEANEYVLFFCMDIFPPELTVGFDSVIDAVEKRFLNPHEHHAYTFFSIVFVVPELDKALRKEIKKYKRRKTYRSGWSLTRVAVVETNCNQVTSNKDGTELAKIFQKQL